jgi:hypothetical protein
MTERDPRPDVLLYHRTGTRHQLGQVTVFYRTSRLALDRPLTARERTVRVACGECGRDVALRVFSAARTRVVLRRWRLALLLGVLLLAGGIGTFPVLPADGADLPWYGYAGLTTLLVVGCGTTALAVVGRRGEVGARLVRTGRADVHQLRRERGKNPS